MKLFPTTTVVISGGGGTGNVAIGPDYGEVGKPAVGVHVAMPATAFAADRGVGVHVAMPAVAFAGNRGVGVHVDLAAAFAGGVGVGVRAGMPAVGFLGDRGVGAHVAMPAVGFSGNRGVGVDVGGTYLGAPAYQSITTASTSSSATSIVVDKPASVAVGDLLVAIIGHGANESVTPPSGWTSILGQGIGNAPACHLQAFYRIADGTEGSSFTFSWSNSEAGFGAILRLIATDPTTPNNAQAATGSAGATDPVAPALTTTAANCFIIACCIQSNLLDSSYTAPAGYVERAELEGFGLLGAHTRDGTIATKVQAASGTVAAATMDNSSLVGAPSVAMHIAIAPGLFTMN